LVLEISPKVQRTDYICNSTLLLALKRCVSTDHVAHNRCWRTFKYRNYCQKLCFHSTSGL